MFRFKMTAKAELMKAHEAMSSVLDVKLKDLPEWQAFRAIDRALIALESEQTPNHPVARPSLKAGIRPPLIPIPYVLLAIRALEAAGAPVPTPAMMEFIGKHRKLDADAEKAKVNVTSSLSKDNRFVSVPWAGGRAWWWSDKPVPQQPQQQGFEGVFK